MKIDKKFKNKNLLQEQIAYYRARTSEYDDWFLRKGKHDYGQKLNTIWFEEIMGWNISVKHTPRYLFYGYGGAK